MAHESHVEDLTDHRRRLEDDGPGTLANNLKVSWSSKISTHTTQNPGQSEPLSDETLLKT